LSEFVVVGRRVWRWWEPAATALTIDLVALRGRLLAVESGRALAAEGAPRRWLEALGRRCLRSIPAIPFIRATPSAVHSPPPACPRAAESAPRCPPPERDAASSYNIKVKKDSLRSREG
jgi:hypothetical protein